jgi:hypothetical protein
MREDTSKLDISTFLLSSIHDMKNSLGVMAAYLEDALATQGDAPTPAREKTTRALYETQRVNDHLIQLLAIYKIDQAFYPFDPQDHALADVAREALARVAGLAASKGIELDCDCSEDLYGWFDYELVFGVVVQALHNALRYSMGRVVLDVAPHQSGVRIRVADDGGGYPDRATAWCAVSASKPAARAWACILPGWWRACTRQASGPESSAWKTAAPWGEAVSRWNCREPRNPAQAGPFHQQHPHHRGLRRHARHPAGYPRPRRRDSNRLRGQRRRGHGPAGAEGL